MQNYRGSCHCGAVKFTIDADVRELTTCDCSLCSRKNALMTKVSEDQLRKALLLLPVWDLYLPQKESFARLLWCERVLSRWIRSVIDPYAQDLWRFHVSDVCATARRMAGAA